MACSQTGAMVSRPIWSKTPTSFAGFAAAVLETVGQTLGKRRIPVFPPWIVLDISFVGPFFKGASFWLGDASYFFRRLTDEWFVNIRPRGNDVH